MRLEKGFKGVGIELSEDLDGDPIKKIIPGSPAVAIVANSEQRPADGG